MYSMQKPIARSGIRIFWGGIYFWIKKQLYWHFSREKFAIQSTKELLPYEIYRHQSLLLRRLKNVEMWMQHNKIRNLRLAAAKMSGLLIHPGEVFSYWRIIGKPTKARGYVDGMILYQGQVRAGTGGGLCQLSNLIYWITLHTPLTVLERWRHSYDVFPDSARMQPFGSGATCSYPNIDLQIRNDTAATFQLEISFTKEYLVGAWRADTQAEVLYEVVEKQHRIEHESWGGYTRHNELYKIGYNREERKKVSEELVTRNDAIMMYEPLLASRSSK